MMLSSFRASGAQALSLALLLAACSRPAQEPDPLPRVLTVVAGAVGGDDEGAGTQVFPATLLARHEVPLAFRAGGRVLTRQIEVGSRVTAEQVLGTLDAADYQLNAALAADQRRAADIELAQAERDAARFGRLGGEGAMPAAEQERQRARADATAQKVQEAGHQAALAERRVAYTELRAPFTGVITQVQFEPGLVVPEGQAVLTDLPEALGARLAHLTLHASLPGAVGAGGPAAVAGAAATRVPLQVREVAPQANPLGRTVRVRLAMQGANTPARRALSGLGRSVDLHVQDAVAPASARTAVSALPGGSATLTLPAGALVQTAGDPFVYVVDAPGGTGTGALTGVLRALPVQVAGYDAALVQVRGVPAGTRVVAAGVQKLQAGLRVTMLERTGSGTDWAAQR